jgi:hypothetical protein
MQRRLSLVGEPYLTAGWAAPAIERLLSVTAYPVGSRHDELSLFGGDFGLALVSGHPVPIAD